MPIRTFVIAECCSSWRFGPESQHLNNAYRMISAAKEAGADAAKFQWTSDPHLMSQRRNDYEPKNYEILVYPFEWLEKLKTKCDEIGIAFMTTVFVAKDIPRIAPLVDRFKVASAESSDLAFIEAHTDYDKFMIISWAFGSIPNYGLLLNQGKEISNLLCVCSYPTPLEQLNLRRLSAVPNERFQAMIKQFSGLSDHTTSTLTGALAVACGATVIEKHVKLWDTPKDNPDYPHSLSFDCDRCGDFGHRCFDAYVENIREAELALGSGENQMMPCEEVNLGRRVKVN